MNVPPTGTKNVKAAGTRMTMLEKWMALQEGKCILCGWKLGLTPDGPDSTWEHLWESARKGGVLIIGDTGVNGKSKKFDEGLVFLAHGKCNANWRKAAEDAPAVLDYALALCAQAGLCA